ncbi:MAG: DUF6056 family protein [Flavobacteriales bacterium]
MTHDRLIKNLLRTGNIFFIGLFLVLSYNNRFAIDDFHFMNNVREMGVWDGMIKEYETWSTRYVSVLLNHTIHMLNETFPAYRIFTFLSFALTVAGFRYFLVSLNTHFFQKEWSKEDWWNAALFLTAFLFFISPGKGETWFWLCSICTYLWSMFFFLFGIGAIFKDKKRNPIAIYFLITISFFYIGGSSAPMALMCIFFCLLLMTFLNKGWLILYDLPAKIVHKRAIYAIFITGLALSILYFGEGNEVRREMLGKRNLFEAFLLNFKITAMVYYYKLPLMIIPLLLFPLPFIYLASYNKMNYSIITMRFYFKKFALISFLCITVTFIHHYSITYAMGDIAPDRGLLPVMFYWLVLTSMAYYYTGMYLRLNAQDNKKFIVMIMICYVGWNAYTLYDQYNITTEYAVSWDKRIEKLKNISPKNDKKVIELKPLPSSGYLYPAEISNDTSYYSNEHLRKAFDLERNISVDGEGFEPV